MSTQTAQGEVQQAIYNVLVPTGALDSTLAALGVTGVFDEVPVNQPFDYLSFGPTTEMPDNAFGRRGYDLTFQIDIWSRQVGFKNAQAILARLNQLIDQQTLTLASQSHVATFYDQSQQMRDPDGLTRHIAARYKILTQE